jgi:aspartyl/asparaginyl beta-hydroxylase (cupin superfamily)
MKCFAAKLVPLVATIGICQAFVPKLLSSTSRASQLFVSSPAATDTNDDALINTTPPPTRPLSPLTFAGQVEAALIDKFGGAEPIQRVLDSWRWADMDYSHKEFVGPRQDPPATDPKSSNCHQLAPSYVADLTCRQFWDSSQFEWAKKLESSYEDIKNEFVGVTADMDSLTKRGNNIWSGALTDDATGYGEGWKTLVLVNRGMWDPVNAKLFPKTAKAVHNSGIPTTECFFASMQPGSDIKLHSDFTNFVLTSHLALVIPENGNNKCRLTIGDEERQWIEGEVMAFDTSIMHSAVNESNEVRYILMFRIWHPDLTPTERDAIQFVYDCLEMPELLSEDAGTRWMAEERVKMARSFPDVGDSSSSKKSGGFALEGRGKKGKKGKKNKKKGGSGGGFGA